MLHIVEAQQSQFILAQTDVMSYAYGVLGSLVFAEQHAQIQVRFRTIRCLRNLSYESYRISAVDTHAHKHICNITSVSTPSGLLSKSLH